MIPGLATPGGNERPRLFGVYPALVTDVQDPDNQGRVQIKLTFVEENDGATALAWARLATLMAGGDRGSWFIPEVDDEVLVAFTAGDPRRPVDSRIAAVCCYVDALGALRRRRTRRTGQPPRAVGGKLYTP